MYDKTEIDRYNELERKYRNARQRFFYLGNCLKMGSLFYFIILVVVLVGRLNLGITKIKSEIILLTIYWCAATGTKLTRMSFNLTPGSGQPYKGILFALSAFACGVVLCYFIR